MDKEWQNSVDAHIADMVMRRRAHEIRLDSVEATVEQFGEKLDENTRLTATIASNTDDLVEFTRTVKWLAKLSQPVGWVIGFVAACVSAYVAVRAAMGK